MSHPRTGLLGSLLLAALSLVACVSTPLVFPAAEAEALADRSISEIWGRAAVAASAAEAELSADIAIPMLDAASLDVNRLKTQMARRHADLKPQFDSGVIGLDAAGYVAVRDAQRVPVEARNALRSVVANENADRAALYREIAAANDRKKWGGEIRDAFANRWIAQAPGGWWYQNANGAWKQK